MSVVGITRGLRVKDVLEGYRRGVFPMGYPGRDEITWHHPRTRAVLPLEGLHVSRSLERRLRKTDFQVTFNQDFGGVMQGCADRETTWISPAIFEVYGQLHRMGRAHSVEVWMDGKLVGGVYGVHLGGAFFAESKFHRVTDMSKVALVHLARRLRERKFALLEVQYWTEHLSQFGVIEIPGAAYTQALAQALSLNCLFP